MQVERRREQSGRGRRTESRQGSHTEAARKPEQLKDLITTTEQKEKQTRDGAGMMEIKEKGDMEHGRERLTLKGSGDGGRRREREQDGTGKRASLEGRDRSKEPEGLRRRVNQLEKEKLEQTSRHNQELSRLEAEMTRLRSSVERGEAQRVELQYQLSVSQRDADRAAELSRDKQELTERAAELQQTVQELHRALDITRQARDEDQHALQQEVEEHDRLIQSFGSENQRLQRLLQDQEEALEELERRIADVHKEKEREADVNRRQADKLKYLSEREERSRREKELLDQRVKSLESSMEAERAAHLESKFTSELLQLRVRDLEAVVVVERSNQQEALSNLELLRAKFREVERTCVLEKERSDSTERALERLQTEHERSQCEQNVAMETERKTTSDLTERLQAEQRQLANTHALLEQAVKRQTDTEEAFMDCLEQIRRTLQQHRDTGSGSAAKDDGSRSPAAEVLRLLETTLCRNQHKLEEAQKQVQDLLLASERLHEDNQRLRQSGSDQSRQIQESQQVSAKLKEELTQLGHKASDWSTQVHELLKERGEWEREREEREQEKEREREDRAAEVQEIRDQNKKEEKVRLSFLYRLYQRLLAGCVLLDQPQSIVGDFTWEELCDVISEQVNQLTSDLQEANDKISRLQRVCEKQRVCVRELQRRQEAVSRLEESVRRREEEATHTVTQLQKELQVCRSQCASLQDRASSLDLRCSSLTSDLSRGRRESACFFLGCALLAGALQHCLCRVRALCEQKRLLIRQQAGTQVLEEEVRRLAAALGGEEEQGGRRARRRWRRAVCVVLAVRRWCSLAKGTAVMFYLEGGGGASVCVCAHEDSRLSAGRAGGRDGLCARWLHSKLLASTILTSMCDLQGALAHTGRPAPFTKTDSAFLHVLYHLGLFSGLSPVDVTSAACSGLSRLLDKLFGRADEASGRMKEDTLRLKSSQANMKALVSRLQQHFLLFSQRLHSAEVERRSLRLEASELKKELRLERKERRERRERMQRTVPADRFYTVCEELHQALSREQEAQALIQQQTNQLQTLLQRVDSHSSAQTNTQNTLSRTTEALSEAQREVKRKERSLRILGKHLSGAQDEKKQLEAKLQQNEDQLRDASRRRDRLISFMKAAETSCQEVRDRLVQSERSLWDLPRPLPLDVSGAELLPGSLEAAACQSLHSVISQLFHTCSSRMERLEQEVSAHRSHVTALRSELQDACLHDNQAFVPVELVDMETLPSAPSSDLSVSLNTAACKPSSAHSKTSPTHFSPQIRPRKL
ncbi:coiled-coil domain-containing protein 171-like isoform X2 [Betta splendens]|uniref:Coiled-coil domain-containing protein 171-like isoform X2 n=1 Tax=Betta splendens TaxID=158456 RepID=A0A9W2XCI0_BETSP|nr:coiled-coil domain-containing protein 171-like isoform X2 [Betta splendens]